MSKKYVTLDENFFPTAFYDDTIHGSVEIEIIDPDYINPAAEDGHNITQAPLIKVANPHTKIPVTAIEITDDQWYQMIENQGCRKLINGTLEVFTKPIPQNQDILRQIYELELNVTPRRVREAILGIDNGWLSNVESEIDALREQL